ncbi:MAG: tyrosine-type recombinase/integrase [Polyangiaceae bacterium]|nr:tyrosine-type recombinase/integrase [Polyangiaceae bacterium]
MAGSAKEIRWDRFPRVEALTEGKKWLEIQHTLGLATNTIEAYARGLEDFLRWCKKSRVDGAKAGRAEVAGFIGDLRKRPSPRGANVVSMESGTGLSNATMQQRLTAIRLFFDYLIEEGHRDTNPVGRGRYTAGKGFGAGKRERGLLPRRKKLPWIPSDEEWRRLLDEARGETIRNRCMLALAYDAGLRREELCGLESGDIQPAHRLLRIRAETSKSRQDRIVPYSETTGVLLGAYLEHRRGLSRKRGPLFLSESRRNRAAPITLWTWSKIVRRLANAAELPQFSTHTLRHLCLTDLARAGWDLHEIARFAGHRNVSVTQQYIHLSGRDLAAKLAKGMAQVHEWRARQIHDLADEKEQS